MLVVFDNHIGQLLPGEVLLGPLLIILILRPVQGLPELVGMPDTGTSCGAGSEMWSLELERPLLHLEWSLPEQSPDLERLLDTESSLDLELLLFSPLLPEPDLLLVLDWDLETDEDISWIL